MNEKAKKPIAVILTIIVTIVWLFLMLYAIFAIVGAVAYKESKKYRQYVCHIPALGSGFTPQGIGYSREADTFIMTGYKGKDTELYLVKNDNAKQVKLLGTDGKALKGHGGGVTCTKDYVYIANEYALHVYSLNALISAASDGTAVSPVTVKNVDNRAAYCFSDDSYLYVGEFYRKGNYETDKAHHYKTPNGKQNRAIVSCYPLDADGKISSVYPDYAVSITDLVQGFAVSGETFMLSRSYGLKNSKLEYYSAPKRDGETVITLSIKNDDGIEPQAVPLYYLDDSSLKRTLTLPAFGEDLAVVNGRVVITNEAACNKYIVGKLFGANKVYSYPIF